MAVFEGAGVALITPFKENGEVNYEKLEELVEDLILLCHNFPRCHIFPSS